MSANHLCNPFYICLFSINIVLLILASQRVEQLLIDFIESYFFMKKPPVFTNDRGQFPGLIEAAIVFFVLGENKSIIFYDVCLL